MIQSCQRPLLGLVMLFAVLSLAACGGGTKFSGTWTNPEFAGMQEVDQVLVVAVADNDNSRRMFETELTNRLNKQGITAYPSVQFHDSIEQMAKDHIQRLIDENGIEAIIVTRLVDVNREEVYVPPSTYVSSYPSYGSPYYGSYYGYYSHGYSVSHSPGYSYEKVTVSLETNLYDASDEALIWSGQSNTFDPGSVQDVIGPTAQIIVEELVGRKLLHPKK
ncbi:hypothetical protein DRQ53_11140 [bacterium]|nr:MAG: hypothetical protein DRQ53_11140 [bacterium]